MSQSFDIRVQIKESMKKELVFGLGARPAIGIMLSYFGYQNEVMHIMQSVSHGTRAYIVNADGLTNFLQITRIHKVLKAAD